MQEQILKSAQALKQPTEKVMHVFAEKQDQLVAKGSQIMAERDDFEKMIGKGNRQMAEDNNRNFARFMASMFAEYKPEVMVETVLWVFRAYRSHGFNTTYWAANLNVWVNMLKKEFPEETFGMIYPFYNWLIVNIPIFVKLTDKDISEHKLSS
jgi:hypothetical protein